MKDRKNIILCVLFFLILAVVPVSFFLTPDAEISKAERRKLQQLPAFSLDGVFSGKYVKTLETYTLDQFPQRDAFRTAKALFSYDVLGKRDNNGLYEYEGSLCKLDYPLSEKQVLVGANKLNSLKEKYLAGSNCWYAIVPDKNYYGGNGNGYPVMDYEKLEQLMRETVRGIDYVNLFDALSLSDYYRTDTHWRQEDLSAVTSALAEAMGFTAPKLSGFTQNTLDGFLGVYAGQSALPVESEPLLYLSDSFTESTVVYDAETKQNYPVYQPEKFTGTDPYDVFLGGAKSLLEIETQAGTGRELLLFRDSFGSSIAPLLLSQYNKITLIDLRYLSSAKLEELIDFHGQDVLFLYSTGVLNSSSMLR